MLEIAWNSKKKLNIEKKFIKNSNNISSISKTAKKHAFKVNKLQYSFEMKTEKSGSFMSGTDNNSGIVLN